ncbi:putative basic helix-loop-helix leucine zipper transcription factor [Helianthus annuus]|nr:putative basic helix-loop-helix leucine zipper transcription factor [Helianthus annuus]
MEGFTSSFHSFKPSFPFIDVDQNMVLLNQFSIQYDNSNMSSQTIMGLPNDNFFCQQVLPSMDHQFMQNFQQGFQHEHKNAKMIPEAVPVENRKRKTMDVSSSSSGNSSSHPLTESGIDEKKYQSMGMAVMLDEIINYVQSLQNQVEMGNVIDGAKMQRPEEREEIGPVDRSFG